MSQLQKLNENICSLEIDLGWNGTTTLTEEEIEALKQYHGFGAIKCILFGDGSYSSWVDQGASVEDLKLYIPMQKLFNLLKSHYSEKDYKKVLSSLKNSVLTAYYTPNILPKTFFEVLKENMEVRTIYECSVGSGVFLTEAFKVFPDIESACIYEKDILTAEVLSVLMESQYGPTVYNLPFEESSDSENGKYDLICSNIPFGDFKVYDPKFKDNNITGKIHNYFFAKGIDKIREGGILAFLVTNSFLDTVSNKTARKYVFDRCDFISLTIMPDNLMMESANVMAPSHFLIVQKNTNKTCLFPEEELLIESSFNEYFYQSKIARNHYVNKNRHYCVIGKEKVGKNQYGKPAIEVKWDKPISEIAEPFSEILRRDFATRGSFNQKPVAKIVDNCDKNQFRNPRQELLDKQNAVKYDFDNFTERMDNMFKPKSEWDEELFAEHEEDTEDHYGVDKCIVCNKIYEECGCKENYAPGDGNDIVWGNAEGEILDMFSQMGNEPIAQQTEVNISEVLPEYLPFKDNLIIEI